MHKKNLALMISALSYGLAVASAPVYSEEEYAEAMLDEIIVTAQKRDEILADVPISISAISSEQMEQANFSSVNELQAMVPALRVDNAGAFSQPTLRGVGSSIAGVGFTSNIATYVDGFYVPSQLTTNMQLLNLQSVQVLKGPQGTLFGRNATGGAILLTMLEPSVVPTATVKASYGSYNKSNLSAYASNGLTDNLAADISGFIEKGDGYVDNIYTGADNDGEVDRKGGRLSLAWDDGDELSVKLVYDHNDWKEGTGYATMPYNGLTKSSGPSAILPTDIRDVSNDHDTWFTADIDGLYLTTRYDMGFAELASFTMARDEYTTHDVDLDSTNLSTFFAEFDVENRSWSQEFNLSGMAMDDTLDWIVGAFFLRSVERYDDFTAGGALGGVTVPAETLYSLKSDNRASALFTDITYSFSDEWALTLGARYSAEDAYGVVDVADFANPAFGALLGLGAGDLIKFDDSWSSFTPRLVLGYKPTDESKIYLSIAQGFKAGQVAPSSLAAVTVDPERITAYELGYKISESKYRFDVAAFYYDYKDMQMATYNGVSAIATNAATSTIYGAETQAYTLLGESVTANIGLAYVHGEYDDYPTAPFWVGGPSELLPNETLRLGGVTFEAVPRNAKGNQMQRSPEFTGNIGLQYSTGLAGGTIKLSSDYFYTSKFFFDPGNQFEQEAYGLLNVSVAWTDSSDSWTASLFGKNVLDEEYRSQVLPGPMAIQQTVGEPATVGVAVLYHM